MALIFPLSLVMPLLSVMLSFTILSRAARKSSSSEQVQGEPLQVQVQVQVFHP